MKNDIGLEKQEKTGVADAVNWIFGRRWSKKPWKIAFSTHISAIVCLQFDFWLLFFQSTAVEMFWGTILRKVKRGLFVNIFFSMTLDG